MIFLYIALICWVWIGLVYSLKMFDVYTEPSKLDKEYNTLHEEYYNYKEYDFIIFDLLSWYLTIYIQRFNLVGKILMCMFISLPYIISILFYVLTVIIVFLIAYTEILILSFKNIFQNIFYKKRSKNSKFKVSEESEKKIYERMKDYQENGKDSLLDFDALIEERKK